MLVFDVDIVESISGYFTLVYTYIYIYMDFNCIDWYVNDFLFALFRSLKYQMPSLFLFSKDVVLSLSNSTEYSK